MLNQWYCCWQELCVNILLSITVKMSSMSPFAETPPHVCIAGCNESEGVYLEKKKPPAAGFTLPSAELYFSGPQRYLRVCGGKQSS